MLCICVRMVVLYTKPIIEFKEYIMHIEIFVWKRLKFIVELVFNRLYH